jgi:hypothetical protein
VSNTSPPPIRGRIGVLTNLRVRRARIQYNWI